VYKDIHRIEDALIPQLMCGAFNTFIEDSEQKGDKRSVQEFQEALRICREEVRYSFVGLDIKNQRKLLNRFSKIYDKIEEYTRRQEFGARKLLLVMTKWADALLEADGYVLKRLEFYDLLQASYDAFNDRRENTTDFDEQNKSANKQMQKIHKLAQDNEYFL
jgi:hypothetical protein